MAADKSMEFVDLPNRIFPFTIKIYSEQTDELLFEQKIDGPGVLDIPGFAPQGHTCRVEVTYANGTTDKIDSNGKTFGKWNG